ncbi:MAG TPA: ABC transporter permease [Gemmataceae bacterium]|nr:ABC transporter permease [Gemmataceae bacterium]
MGNYMSAIWRCRYFWISLVRMDLRTRYRRSILGMGWSLLHPIAMTIILCAVFATLFKQPIRQFGPFLMAGLVTWNYIVASAMVGCQCFFQGESYIRQYPAPLAVYPLRTALGGTVHFLIAMIVVVGLAWSCLGVQNPLTLLTLIPSFLLLFVFTWSLATIAGFANVHFQDTQHLTEVGFQILFYLSPIMFDPKDPQLNERIRSVLSWNPLVPLFELIREPILKGNLPSATTFMFAATIVLVAFCVAAVTLGRLQRRLIFYL